MRQVGHDLVGAPGEPGIGQQRVGFGAQLPVGAHIGQEAKTVALAHLDGDRDIVADGIVRQQAGDLERTRKPARNPLGGCKPVDPLAVELDRAAIGTQLAEKLRDQRRLAGAVGADERVNFAGAHVEIDRVGGQQASETLDEAANGQNGGRHARLPARRSARACTPPCV
jgi:hypothetical protein